MSNFDKNLFNAAYYESCLEMAEKLVLSDLNILKKVKGGAALRVVKLLSQMSKEEQIELLVAKLKYVFQSDVDRARKSLTTRDGEIVNKALNAYRFMIMFSGSDLVYENSKVKKTLLYDLLITRMNAKNYNIIKKIKSNLIIEEREYRGVKVQTHYEIGGKTFFLRHSLALFDKDMKPLCDFNYNISSMNNTGFNNSTDWHHPQQSEDIANIVDSCLEVNEITRTQINLVLDASFCHENETRN